MIDSFPSAADAEKAASATPVVLFCGADILFGEDRKDRPESLPVLDPSLLPQGVDTAAFSFKGAGYQAAELREGETAIPSVLVRLPLRQFIGSIPELVSSFALKARAYAHWASISRYCSACGSPLSRGCGPDGEGGRLCGNCGRIFFPRISPAVIVLISRGDEILLAHNVKFPQGRHGLIAGFVELGETLEDTLRREVMEEAGIEVGEPRYVRSQPWPFPDSLMLGFEAEYLSGEARPDGIEIDQVGWFSIDALPDIPPPGSVAWQLIERFIAARHGLSNS
ncbi:MAG: NAD(+) diphosphatase [Spirochaetes bacterium]|nr:NAD(+) diphosphatase [Spirochaetota bacterium]